MVSNNVDSLSAFNFIHVIFMLQYIIVYFLKIGQGPLQKSLETTIFFLSGLTKIVSNNVESLSAFNFIHVNFLCQFFSLPVHIARWAHMRHFLSVCLSVRHWIKIHISESILCFLLTTVVELWTVFDEHYSLLDQSNNMGRCISTDHF